MESPLSLVIFLLPSLITACTIAGPTDPNIPWTINRVTTSSPSGYPGSNPWSQVSVSISDTNCIDAGRSAHGGQLSLGPQAANCTLRFSSRLGETPWDRPLLCGQETGYDGRWTWWVRKPREGSSERDASWTNNFDLEFALENKIYTGSDNHLLEMTWSGRKHFESGKNLLYTCSAAGACGSGLLDGTPVTLAPNLSYFKNGTESK